MDGQQIEIRLARPEDAGVVCDILAEAADWLARRGEAMWRLRYHSDRHVGPYHVARYEYPLPP